MDRDDSNPGKEGQISMMSRKANLVRGSPCRRCGEASCDTFREVANREPNLRYGKFQQLVREPSKFGRYDEVPMASVVRSVMFAIMPRARFVIAAATAGVMMMLMATNMPMPLQGIFVLRRGGFDMDMRYVISWMTVPQGGAGPGYRAGIEQ
jgi:hypothetical protein